MPKKSNSTIVLTPSRDPLPKVPEDKNTSGVKTGFSSKFLRLRAAKEQACNLFSTFNATVGLTLKGSAPAVKVTLREKTPNMNLPESINDCPVVYIFGGQ